ncbi:MAG: NAD-dependent epimerase/dehydratase family protein [Candidatus Omnitrophica bacterium]|nr:NAD-dependent epimerase/dehydratase family protein [Candidatus Omnitrophota bacterium]
MAKKVLITGGAGFIGRAVAKKLVAMDFDVRVFDLEFSAKEASEIKKLRGSILDSNALCNAVRGCDYVVHLAAMLGVRRTELKRAECLNVNILGTVNVLEACLKEKVKKIIFSSSSEVYGETDGIPINEDTPKHPVSIYAITKLSGEEYIKAYWERYGLNYSIVRFFNVYGPGQVAEFVVPRFVKRVLNNKAPVVYGDGTQVRTFCFVEDCAQGVTQALLDTKADGQIFNIGNDSEPIAMKLLAERIIRLSGKKLEPEFVPMNESDRHSSREIKMRVPCINKARKILAFEPKTSLDEGIKRLIESEDITDAWCEDL